MAGKIFINYRKAANLVEAKLLRHRLQKHFGENGVFLDINGLEGGDYWPETLAKQVDDSIAMVALICEGWADIRDADGQRRLENPNDFVRVEISRAFARKIPFIPVMIDGATMPGHTELPLEIAG
ncbi:MAG: TIR domain-containing protein, partial [Alphaproteobacteria bacterium]